MTDEQIKRQLEAIKEATKEACKTKESAIKFLTDAGIIPPTAHTEELTREGEVTAMQELIEFKNDLEKNRGMELTALRILDKVMDKATELLTKEMEQIEKAHDKGISRYCQWEPERHGNEQPTGKDYFTNTYTKQ